MICPAVASSSLAATGVPARCKSSKPASPARVRVNSRFHGKVVAMAVVDDPGSRGSTGVLDRPKFDQSSDGGVATTESGYGASDVDKRKKLGGGHYRVLLLDHPNHSEKLVTKVITTVVPDVDEERARNCFHTSRDLGMAIVTTCLKEHAEHYCQQMFRYGCRSSIEPDSTTI